ncbi:hypothetical protein MBLNU230_g5555t1 [Neophaeotheca triangularis]
MPDQSSRPMISLEINFGGSNGLKHAGQRVSAAFKSLPTRLRESHVSKPAWTFFALRVLQIVVGTLAMTLGGWSLSMAFGLLCMIAASIGMVVFWIYELAGKRWNWLDTCCVLLDALLAVLFLASGIVLAVFLGTTDCREPYDECEGFLIGMILDFLASGTCVVIAVLGFLRRKLAVAMRKLTHYHSQPETSDQKPARHPELQEQSAEPKVAEADNAHERFEMSAWTAPAELPPGVSNERVELLQNGRATYEMEASALSKFK